MGTVIEFPRSAQQQAAPPALASPAGEALIAALRRKVEGCGGRWENLSADKVRRLHAIMLEATPKPRRR